MHQLVFYNELIIRPYMFRALCADHQEVKLYYTAFGIVTLCRCDDIRCSQVWWYQTLY